MSVCSVLFLFVSAESHQVLAQLLDTLLVIGTQLPESPAVRQRLIEVACKVTNTYSTHSLHYQVFCADLTLLPAQSNKILLCYLSVSSS